MPKIMTLCNTISYNLQALLGRKTNRKILVIESDDWGSIRMPSKKSYDNLLNSGIAVDKCPFNTFDSLETTEDIEALNDLCIRFKDKNGKPLKVTANFNMANPDFERIQTDNFEKYHYSDLTETYEHYQGNTRTLDSLLIAIENNVLVPQLHGREHLQVNHWLSAIKANDVETKVAFDNGIWGHPSNFGKRSGINFSSAFHISEFDELEFIGESVIDAARLFEKTFDFKSSTFISPRYIWPIELEMYFKKCGIQTLQGTMIQRYPNLKVGSNELKRKINWMGKNNSMGLNYLTRNVFFEPSVQPNYAWESDAKKRVDTAFFWGKPAIISMHRLNFMGGLSKQNREISLSRLSKLLKLVTKEWPEVEFLGSDELAKIYI